jgi:transcriptional regulator with XRE-family HTH domain
MPSKGKDRSARLVFAQNLREARRVLGLSQEELAERSGLHRTYVGSVERAERNVSIDNMELLAHAVGQTLAEMVTS